MRRRGSGGAAAAVLAAAVVLAVGLAGPAAARDWLPVPAHCGLLSGNIDAARAAPCDELVVAGLHSTGSTMVYKLLEHLGKAMPWSAAKEHRRPCPGDRGCDCTLVTYRDPRAIAVSSCRRITAPCFQNCTAVELEDCAVGMIDQLQSEFERLRGYRRRGATLLRYEDMAEDCVPNLVEWLATYLGIDFSLDTKRALARSLDKDEVHLALRQQGWHDVPFRYQSSAVDEYGQKKMSHIHGRHVTSAGLVGEEVWRSGLTDHALATLNEGLGDILRDLRYPLA